MVQYVYWQFSNLLAVLICDIRQQFLLDVRPTKTKYYGTETHPILANELQYSSAPRPPFPPSFPPSLGVVFLFFIDLRRVFLLLM